jgi:dihydroxyacetone kinase-like protein
MASEGPVPVARLVHWLERWQDLVHRDRDHLTQLDAAIGDADHGLNMDRGLAAVVAALHPGPPPTADLLGRSVGMTLVSTVGGASGPLYGTFFLRFGSAAGPVEELDAAGLARALRAGVEGVVARGRGDQGDKTMLDALLPAVAAFEGAVGSGPAAAAATALAEARSGRDATIPMIARKGRASYLGERSVGHLDPGAASAALLVEALADVLAGRG